MFVSAVGLLLALGVFVFLKWSLLLVPVELEHEKPIFSGIVDFARVADLEELNKHSALIAEVEVLEQDLFYEGIVQTRSLVRIKQVYRGDPEGETIYITETGGPLKEQDAEETVYGSTVMKPGSTYVVFLKKGSLHETFGYSVTGTVQGKIKVDEATGRLTATVPRNELRDHRHLFFLQIEFAGQEKDALVKEILRNKVSP